MSECWRAARGLPPCKRPPGDRLAEAVRAMLAAVDGGGAVIDPERFREQVAAVRRLLGDQEC